MILKRKKKYIVAIPRQGGQKIIGRIDAKNLNDAINTLPDLLEEYRDDPALKRAKNVILIETDSGGRSKIKNPFYDPEFAKQFRHGQHKKNEDLPTPEEIEATAYLNVATNIATNIAKIMPNMFNTMINATTEAFKEMAKEMVKKASEENSYNKLNSLANLIQSLILLAQNREQIKQLIKDIKPELIQQFLGGENVTATSKTTKKHT